MLSALAAAPAIEGIYKTASNARMMADGTCGLMVSSALSKTEFVTVGLPCQAGAAAHHYAE